MDIPLEEIRPRFYQNIPPDLQARIQTPTSEIQVLLNSRSKSDRGLGLELLVLRMLLDLGLSPTGFRQRSEDTAHAEIDVMAEGAKLVFSRWTVQCKCHSTQRVGLSNVAKEVGIAIHQKAHVVCVVTTSDFTASARRYAEQIQHDTHLQFVLITGEVIEKYLQHGRVPLLEFVMANARAVMSQKREELLVGD